MSAIKFTTKHVFAFPTAVLAASLFLTPACSSSKKPSRASTTKAEAPSIGALMSASTPIGTLPGKAGVSHNGAATYSVPIEVPNGRAGIQPTLSINYSSNGGAGPMGIGFSLGGVSAIVRCPIETLHPEVIHANAVDLCFGGRLLLTQGEHGQPGAVYRVHGSPALRITRAGDPGDGQGSVSPGFIVSYPDGKTGLFGTAADSIVTVSKHTGGSHEVAWYLTWLEDNHGNRMRYTYLEEDTGSIRLPSEIRYTFSYVSSEAYADLDYGSRSVTFNYEERAVEDVYTAFRGLEMGRVEMNRLLASIETSADDELVHKYQFQYKNWTQSRRSILHAMNKCDTDGVCLPYTQFDWELGEDGYEVVNLPAAAANTAPNFGEIAASVMMDIDHDGKMELLFAYDSRADDGSARWNMWDPETGIDPTPVPAWFIEGSAALAPTVADINGDGVADLVTPYCTDGECVDDTSFAPMRYQYANRVRVVLGDASDDDGIAVWAYPDLIETNDRIFMTHIAEIDGDGYPDMFACRADAADGGRWHLMLNRPAENNGVGRQFISERTGRPCFASDLYQVMDADGDGRDELWVAGKSTPRFNQGTFSQFDPTYDLGDPIGAAGYVTYVGLQLPHVDASGTILPIADAIALAKQPSGEVGWPEVGIVRHGLPLDFSQRVLQGCWRPESEEVFPSALYDQIAAASGQAVADQVSSLYQLPSKPSDEDGTIPGWLENENFDEFVIPPAGTLIPANVPFVNAGGSADRRVDINGDGLTDVARMTALNGDGEPIIVFEQANAGSPATCRADDLFDFGFKFFINTGTSFERAGTLKLLSGVRPWQGAQMLSRVTSIDYNSDGRTDWLSPDFGKFFGDDDIAPPGGGAPSGGAVDQWEILVAQPMVGTDGPVEFVELDLELNRLWYDGSFQWSQGLEKHLAALFKGWGHPYAAEIDTDEFPDLVSRSVTAIHLSDRHLQDIMFFPGTDSADSVLAGAKAGNRPDYLLRVTDGLGAITEWDYRPGHDSSVYGMDDATEFAVPFTPSMLVSAHRSDTGLGADSWMHKTYRYVGAYADRRGLGGLGLRQRTVATRAQNESEASQFSRTEKAHVTSYDPNHRAFSRAGITTRTVTDTAFDSGGPRRYVVESLATSETIDAPHSNYTVGTTQSRSRTFDLHDGIHQCVGAPCGESALAGETPLKSTQTDVEDFDELGRALDWTVNHGAGVTTQTVLEIDNHASNSDKPYAAGLERRRLVTDTTPNGSATREIATEYTAETLSLLRTTREPNDTSETLLRQTKYGRDVRGNVNMVTVTTADETQISTVTHDAQGYFPASQTNAEGHKSTSHWHAGLGVMVRAIDPNGVVSESCIDGFGRPTCARTLSSLFGQTTGEEFTFELHPVPANFVGEAAYRLSTYRNGSYQLHVDSDRLGRGKRSTYRVFNEANELGDEYQVLTTYDERFNTASVSNPIPTAFPPAVIPVTEYIYDRLGRERERLRPDGNSAKRFYQGLRTVHTDASGDETKLDVDVLGRLVKRTTGAFSICFGYGAFSTVVGAVRNCDEADGSPTRTTVQAFDNWSRREVLQDPELGDRYETWDALDQPDTMVDGKGDATVYSFDNLGRLEERTSVDGTATFTYDTQINGVGKPDSSTSEDGTVFRQQYYDSFGRPSQSVTEVNGDSFVVESEYAQNRLHRIHYPSIPFLKSNLPFRVRYQYGFTGDVTHVYDDVSGDLLWELEGMNGFRHITQENASQNEFVTQRHYDELSGRQTQDYVADAEGTAVVARSYGWTGDGNLELVSDLVGGTTRSYGYDALDQLRTTFDGNQETASVKYNIYGNIDEKSDVGEYKYDETTGRLSSVADQTFHYDANGSVVVRSDQKGETSFEWTALGKLREAKAESGTASFDYDASGVEVRKTIDGGTTTTTIGPLFQHRQGNGVGEYRYTITNGSRSVAQVTRELAPIYKETLRYLHADYRGSTLATSEVGGDVTLHDYDPWGQKLGGVSLFSEENVTTGFTGHDAEVVDGLIDMRARYYDPRLGRFISADTIVPNPTNGLDWNRYAYVRNNPLRWIDPSGHGPAAPSEPTDRGPGDGDGDGPSDDVGDAPEGGTYDPNEGVCSVNGKVGDCDDIRYGPFGPQPPPSGVTGANGMGRDSRLLGDGTVDSGPYLCAAGDSDCERVRRDAIEYLYDRARPRLKLPFWTKEYKKGRRIMEILEGHYNMVERDGKLYEVAEDHRAADERVYDVLGKGAKHVGGFLAPSDWDGNGTNLDEVVMISPIVLGGAVAVGAAKGLSFGPWGAAAGAGFALWSVWASERVDRQQEERKLQE